MTTYLNLTPHKINVYDSTDYVNLEFVEGYDVWVADGVCEDAEGLVFACAGSARIATETSSLGAHDGVCLFEMLYGDLIGLPDEDLAEYYIVSLPTKMAAMASGHPLAKRLVVPWVVRSRADTGLILGCLGLIQ